MSPEKQRIAIAEACGWEWKKYGDTMAWYNWSMKWVRAVCGICPDIVPVDPLPDYLNDLNAMHEAEKVLKVEQHFTFQVELARVINTITYPLNFALLHSTAAQRAEAFLKTIGLWKD